MNTSFFLRKAYVSPLRSLKAIVLFLFLFGASFTSNLFAQQLIQRQIARPVRFAVVNMQQLADLEALLPHPVINRPGFIPNKGAEYEEPPSSVIAPSERPPGVNMPTVVSPSPVLTYEGVPDAAKVDGPSAGFWTIPPDTYGAVGLDKVFTQVNNNYRILNKTTGAQLSIVSIETFWSALGADGQDVFDPRVVYDPYNNRWIVAAVSHGSDPASRVLMGISQTHDPQGNYNLYSFDPDPGTANWADFPMLGFNKNWIAVGINMFPIAAGSPPNRFYVIDYPALRSGTMTATVFTGTTFCSHPAETYSSTESTLYAPAHLSSGGATYQLNTVTGTPAVPVFTVGATKTRTGGGWATSGGNIMPQQCLSACPGTLVFADPGDQFIRNNVVFRNGFVWYSQTVRLPAATPTHSLVQWTKVDAATGNFSDGGRIEDPTATSSNGGRWYGHPSISVNNSNDVLVGYAKGESDGYLGGAYSFRLSTDAAGTTQDPVVYKDGEDYYEKDFGAGRNRWGDYSHTMVDPLDDASFWTIQEYAKPRVAPVIGGSNSKWGTWWAKVAPNACLSNVASGNWNTAATWGCGSVPNATNHVNIMSGQNVTLDIDPLAASITVNAGGTLTVSTSRTLSCKLIVYGTLNITGGKLTLGANDVFLAQGATLTGASPTSYFITNGTGKVTKIIAASTSFEFPVSPNATSYNSLTINNSSGPIEVFSVRVSAGLSPATSNNAICVQRTWNITEMTPGGNSATLTFKWASAEHGGSFSASVPPYAYRHNGSTYVLASSMTLPVLASGIYSSSTGAPVSTFSPWIISGSSTLPILLDYFTGSKLSNGSHKLDWKATCTGSNAGFELQRSGDGRNFSSLSIINADYLRCLQPFDFTDNTPLNGKNFYRVKMRDEIGKITYSNTILLLNGKADFEIVNLQPNPVSGSAVLNFIVPGSQRLTIFITDQKGSRVMQKDITAIAGPNKEDIDFSSLATGAYILSVVSVNGDQQVIRFVKQ